MSQEVKERLPLIQYKTFPNIEDGTLFVTTVGSEETPATMRDVQIVTETIDSFFEGVTGVKALVSHHGIKVKAFPLTEDGMLFTVTVGSETVTPTDSDIERVKGVVNDLFKDTPTVKAVIIPKK